MKATHRAASFFYALLLIACAGYAGFEVWAFAFGIGDGDGQVGFGVGVLFAATLIGIGGLLIAAASSWAKKRLFRWIALGSVLLVIPAAALFSISQGRAILSNMDLGFHYSAFDLSTILLPVPLDCAALIVGMRRFGFRRATAPASAS
jgi:hypothetical protein